MFHAEYITAVLDDYPPQIYICGNLMNIIRVIQNIVFTTLLTTKWIYIMCWPHYKKNMFK